MRLSTIILLAVGLAPAGDAQAPMRTTTYADSLLGRLVGRWQMRGQARGKPVAYDATGARTLGGRFVELHMSGSAGNAPYEARVFIGADTAPSRIDVHWMDTWGAAFSVPAATGYARRDTLRFEFLYSDGPFRDTFVWLPAERAWHMVLEKGDGLGGWSLFADFRATRHSSAEPKP